MIIDDPLWRSVLIDRPVWLRPAMGGIGALIVLGLARLLRKRAETAPERQIL